MSWLYRHLIRPVLFAQDPEEIHRLTLQALAWVSRHRLFTEATASFFEAPNLPCEVFGLSFPNPVGLAAGMDKDGEAVPVWAALGFGYSELGAVTWHAQPGNPSPRVFRVIPDEAIINRMGFNNAGTAVLAEKLAQWRTLGLWPDHPVGINLGKSKITPLEQAPEEYAQSLRVLLPHADFFVVNVSSPNTPNLRQLQDKAALDEILSALQEVQQATLAAQTAQPEACAASTPTSSSQPGNSLHQTTFTNHGSRITDHGPKHKPILVKIAPDLSFEALDDILGLVSPRQIAGIVATNTTLTRPTTDDPDLSRLYGETGGLSGRPLNARSTEVIRHLYRQTRSTLPIIGVGGIFNADDAWEKIAAGASLVQVYTGMVYEGPDLAQAIVTGLQAHLGARGMQNLSQAVGCENARSLK